MVAERFDPELVCRHLQEAHRAISDGVTSSSLEAFNRAQRDGTYTIDEIRWDLNYDKNAIQQDPRILLIANISGQIFSLLGGDMVLSKGEPSPDDIDTFTRWAICFRHRDVFQG